MDKIEKFGLSFFILCSVGYYGLILSDGGLIDLVLALAYLPGIFWGFGVFFEGESKILNYIRGLDKNERERNYNFED